MAAQNLLTVFLKRKENSYALHLSTRDLMHAATAYVTPEIEGKGGGRKEVSLLRMY